MGRALLQAAGCRGEGLPVTHREQALLSSSQGLPGGGGSEGREGCVRLQAAVDTGWEPSRTGSSQLPTARGVSTQELERVSESSGPGALGPVGWPRQACPAGSTGASGPRGHGSLSRARAQGPAPRRARVHTASPRMAPAPAPTRRAGPALGRGDSCWSLAFQTRGQAFG